MSLETFRLSMMLAGMAFILGIAVGIWSVIFAETHPDSMLGKFMEEHDEK